MRKITKSNVHYLCAQFTLENLTTGRACVDGCWDSVDIDDSFADAYNNIAELLGGRAETKKKIAYILRNNPISDWFANRIVFCRHTNRWEYTAGQDYPSEIRNIRQTLLKRY